MNISIENLSYHFQQEKVLENFSCNIPNGKITSILGRSGCGKSTLLNIIAGLLPYQSGRILYNGKSNFGGIIGYMTQKDLLLPFKTVLGNLMLVCLLQKEDKKESEAKILNLLEKFGLLNTINMYPKELSGGIRQRIHMIRQFLVKSSLILLDEPFGALDMITKEKIQEELLLHIKETEKTAILVTHDTKEAIYFSNEILILGRQGQNQSASLQDRFLINSNLSFIESANIEQKIIQALKEYF